MNGCVDCITKILCTRTNQDIHYIAQAYQIKYGKSLEEEIGGEVSGHYKRLLVMLLSVSLDIFSVEDFESYKSIL